MRFRFLASDALGLEPDRAGHVWELLSCRALKSKEAIPYIEAKHVLKSTTPMECDYLIMKRRLLRGRPSFFMYVSSVSTYQMLFLKRYGSSNPPLICTRGALRQRKLVRVPCGLGCLFVITYTLTAQKSVCCSRRAVHPSVPTSGRGKDKRSIASENSPARNHPSVS